VTDWPVLPVPGWAETRPTLHRWTQILGKIRLALTPPVNHFWHSTLYVGTRGLTTSPIPYGSDLFEITFDFVDQELRIVTSWGPRRDLPLGPRSVADFYADLMSALQDLGIDVHIWTKPVEIADRTPFDVDREHAAYDADAAHAFWRSLVQVDRVFHQFRGRFLGKCSPVHFFWGGFDLAVTRFSGRRAPAYASAAPHVHPHVMHESYSHEVSSAGFWLGDEQSPPMFYSYTVPTPPEFHVQSVRPAQAGWFDPLGEFVLPYSSVQESVSPDATLLEFLQSTYDAAADTGHWDRELLEQQPSCSCTPAEIRAFEAFEGELNVRR